MSSFVSSILQHSANRIDDMPFLGSRSKRQSLPTGSSSGMMDAYQQQQYQQHRNSAEYYNHPHHVGGNNNPVGPMTMGSSPPPSYEAMMMQSPQPTPSTSWTSDMNLLADKIKNDHHHDDTSSTANKQLVMQQLDRRSISQGLKLVSIAADEYDGGNEMVALDIYLTGLDKILMALPNKTDPKTKLALREKLLSVEERVGILNLASQQNNANNSNNNTNDNNIETIQAKTSLQSYIFSRITTTISTISNISSHAETRYEHVYQEEEDGDLSRHKNNNRTSRHRSGDPINRFKRFGQFVVQMTVTMAVMIKQSPLPDIFCFLFGYFIQFLIWFDHQYHVVERVQDFGVECLKMLLQADEEYRLHELVSEAVYMLIAAGLKAVVAFKEAPGYKEHHSSSSSAAHHPQRRHYNRNFSSNSSSPPPVVKNNNNTRITWSWAPW
ncbi:hypothetical protein BDA99DRAFT_538009 [Phascolomyces articulosus]|uniref:Uncharacterized protein n=1 Tax=Phascolomyces articulosus TaxID=60185 RepID=A0AAD5K9A5_9FUNG|nr:hypothetical protein BDA99DRAFT_538009 [Phascolomyces articulosus]